MIDRHEQSKDANKECLPWYRRMLVGIEIGPTGANDKDDVYIARATGKEIIENLAKARAEYAIIFMKDQNFAYYNSKIARKCPNLGQRDLLRECLDEANMHNILIIAYCQIQWDTSTWLTHPEWRMKDNEGKDVPNYLCYNSAGYLEYIQKIASELMEYEISGFHFDVLTWPPYGSVGYSCWCERCQLLFKEKYGIDMPRGVTWDESWEKMLEFRYESGARFSEELRSFVKSKRPELSVDFNYHGYPAFDWQVGQRPVQHAIVSDFVSAEGAPWGYGQSMPSLLSLFMAGTCPDIPYQGVTSRFVYGYHDFTVRPVADMKWEVFTYLSHGAMCTIVDKSNYNGTLDPVAFERIGQVFDEARQKRDYFGHKPIQEVALYYSSRSRDWFGRENSRKYRACFYGAHKALMQSHITMGVIVDESVSLGRLQEFPMVYIPNAAILTEKEVDLFGEYVYDGGNLLVTGLTGCYDYYGDLQDRCVLESIIGARLVRCFVEYSDNYIRLPKELTDGNGLFLLKDIPSDWPILTWGSIAAFESTGAQSFGELMVAYRSHDNPWSHHMSADKVVGPAVLVNEHGKGRVIYVPCSPDAAFIGDYRMPEHRNLIRNLVRYLHPKPEVLVKAPLNVEVVVTQDETGSRMFIHFVCFLGSPTATATSPNSRRVLPSLMEEASHYTAQIKVNQPFSNVEAASRETKVSWKGDEISMETVSIHEVLTIHLCRK